MSNLEVSEAQAVRKSYLDNPLALGLFRASLMFPVEHFVDMTKVASQKSPELSSWKVIKDVYDKKGFRGFMDGALVNYPRRVLRDTVRWPIIGYSYNALISKFPEVFPEKSTTSFVFSGLAVALFDSCVLGPLELLMSYKVKESGGYKKFFRDRFFKEGIPSLYRGVGVNLTYRGAVWTLYMGVDSEIKKKFQSGNHSSLSAYTQQVISATVVSTVLVATLLPVDFIKTQIQIDPSLHRKKISCVVKDLVQKHGFFRFYAGAPIVWASNIAYVLVFQKVVQKSIEICK